MILPFLLAALAGLSPAGAEGVARAIANEAARSGAFDVISELDVKDAVDFEAARQTCGGAGSDSCASTIARLQDARLLLSPRVYAADGSLVLGLTLFDLKTNGVLYRGDAATSEAQMLETAARETAAALASAVDLERGSRLLVTRVAFDDDTLRRSRLTRKLSEINDELDRGELFSGVTYGVLAAATVVMIAGLVGIEMNMPDADNVMRSLREQVDVDLITSAIVFAVAGVGSMGLAITVQTIDEEQKVRTVRKENLEAELDEIADQR